ncbi:hypothetical protein H6G96_28440 [Nostoc sp. FACHB-892]|uniref:hypothetical protein n=1 Tax=Nostoc sp. FACHB-892 TaxID=2692843 RepID=UPI001686C1D1|nr:hypothetical protein [Nostoc sp. FACHB-892]MBD2730142.1 hypothetical protein [Nostoc sp. FACHB-892]
MQTTSVVPGSQGRDISYQILTEDNLKSAVECISNTFYLGEPMTKALGITLKEFKHFTGILAKKAIINKLSVVAIDNITRKVVGVLIAEDFMTEPPTSIKTVSPKFLPMFEVIGTLDAKYRAKYPVKLGELYHLLMVGVYREYAGLSVPLTRTAEIIARSKGYVAAIGETTNPIAYKIYTKRLGFKDVEGVEPITYASFKYSGKRIFADISDCISCQIIRKDYRV